MARHTLVALLSLCLLWAAGVQAAQPYTFTATLEFETTAGFAPATESLFAAGTSLAGRLNYDPAAAQDFSGEFGFQSPLSGYSLALEELEVEVDGLTVGAATAPLLIGNDVPFPVPLGVEIEPFDLLLAAAGELDDGSGIAGEGWRDAALEGDRGRISMVRIFLLAAAGFQTVPGLPEALELEDFDYAGNPLLASCVGCGFWNGAVQRHVVLTVTRDDGSQQFAWFRIDSLASGDADGDGVSADACPDTAAGALVDARGCSIAQTCPCDGFRNHGQRMACVTRAVEDLVQIGALDQRERGRNVSAFARDRSCR